MKRDAGNDDRPSDFCFGTKQLLLRQSWARCSSPAAAAEAAAAAAAAAAMQVAAQTFATNLDQLLAAVEIKMFYR